MSARLSDEKLAEIAERCKGVTPGPWGEGDKWVFASPRSGNPSHALEHIFRNEEAQTNVAYVARLDPQTVLSLVTELQHSRAEEAVAPEDGSLDEGINYAIGALAEILGVDEWQQREGSEDFGQDVRDTIRGVLDSASPSATGVRVKALEWREYSLKHDYGAGSWEANGVGSGYQILDVGQGGENGARYYLRGRAQFDTLDGAKAAAQSDYEAHILSALAGQP